MTASGRVCFRCDVNKSPSNSADTKFLVLFNFIIMKCYCKFKYYVSSSFVWIFKQGNPS